ncbi:MAG: hypothetical protein IKX79_02125, partial [Desulfovibrionaceae bacterium]|nr:hypothetical protein [Desulfovibrionaceae bacterium]
VMGACPPDENSAGAKKLKKKLEKLVDDPKRREVMFKVFLRAASNDSIDSILEDAYAEVYGQGCENEFFEDTHAEIEAETAESWNLDTFIAVHEGRHCVYLDEDSPIIKPAAEGSEARRVDIKKLLREEEESDDWEGWEFLDDADGVAYCVMPAE